jgi:type II secretory pathway component HofQ
MNPTTSVKALLALGAVASMLNSTHFALGAQSAPEPAAKVQIDTRILYTSRDVARTFDVDWNGSPSGLAGLSMGVLNGSPDLDETLAALERAGRGKVEARPRVLAANNTEVEIVHGFQVPVQTVANNTVTVRWHDAGLSLRVRPSVTPAKLVTMHVDLTTPTVKAMFNAKRDGTMVIGGIALTADPNSSREALVFLTPRIVE